jgi:hypothetical protein
VRRLKQGCSAIDGITDQAEYDNLHADFCQRFIQTNRTAERRLKSGQTKPSRPRSYGQAAKVLDVAAKVYAYDCGQPSPEAA